MCGTTAENVSTAEKLHVLALDGVVHGRYREATVVYETILREDHSDLLALRCCFDLYLLLGCVLWLRACLPYDANRVVGFVAVVHDDWHCAATATTCSRRSRAACRRGHPTTPVGEAADLPPCAYMRTKAHSSMCRTCERRVQPPPVDASIRPAGCWSPGCGRGAGGEGSFDEWERPMGLWVAVLMSQTRVRACAVGLTSPVRRDYMWPQSTRCCTSSKVARTLTTEQATPTNTRYSAGASIVMETSKTDPSMRLQDAFDNGGPMERHLYFQWALFLLELGRYDRIDKMLETSIFPRLRDGHHHSYQTLSDATQLFWRLRFAGHDTEGLAQQLHESWLAVADFEAENRDAFHPSLPPLAKICQHVSCLL